MAIIKSGATTDQWTIDPTSKAGRVTLYDASGNPLTTVPISGSVGQGSPNIAANSWPVKLTDGVDIATINADGSFNINIQDVSGNAVVTKGIQGAGAVTTQDFKDSGRVIKFYTASFTAAAAEALVSLTPVTDGTSGVAAATFGVTAGKRFRIQALMLTCFNTTAAIHACQVNLRVSATGAVTTSSPIIGTIGTTTAAATIGEANSQAQSFPDGIELSGTMQFGISEIGIALAGQTVVLVGYEY